MIGTEIFFTRRKAFLLIALLVILVVLDAAFLATTTDPLEGLLVATASVLTGFTVRLWSGYWLRRYKNDEGH